MGKPKIECYREVGSERVAAAPSQTLRGRRHPKALTGLCYFRLSLPPPVERVGPDSASSCTLPAHCFLPTAFSALCLLLSAFCLLPTPHSPLLSVLGATQERHLARAQHNLPYMIGVGQGLVQIEIVARLQDACWTTCCTSQSGTVMLPTVTLSICTRAPVFSD